MLTLAECTQSDHAVSGAERPEGCSPDRKVFATETSVLFTTDLAGAAKLFTVGCGAATGFLAAG